MTYRVQLQSGKWTTAERVTQIVRRGMPSPQLEAWKMREVVRYALEHPALINDPDAVIASWDKSSRGAADRGTSVHREIARYLTTGEGGDSPFFDAWYAWYCAHQGRPARWVEQTLLSADGKVAGTADVIFADTMTDAVLCDWKTSEKQGPAWPDQIAQVGGYASMAHLVDDKKVSGPAPTITEARIVRLCADGTWSETVLAGKGLSDAKNLWAAVRQVAEAVMA